MRTPRNGPRKSIRLPVSLGGRLPAMSLDLSRSGFSIELPQVFLPGSKLHGYVLDGDRELPFEGTVAWATPGDPRLSVYSRIGVRFTRRSPDLERLLIQVR